MNTDPHPIGGFIVVQYGGVYSDTYRDPGTTCVYGPFATESEANNVAALLSDDGTDWRGPTHAEVYPLGGLDTFDAMAWIYDRFGESWADAAWLLDAEDNAAQPEALDQLYPAWREELAAKVAAEQAEIEEWERTHPEEVQKRAQEAEERARKAQADMADMEARWALREAQATKAKAERHRGHVLTRKPPTPF